MNLKPGTLTLHMPGFTKYLRELDGSTVNPWGLGFYTTADPHIKRLCMNRARPDNPLEVTEVLDYVGCFYRTTTDGHDTWHYIPEDYVYSRSLTHARNARVIFYRETEDGSQHYLLPGQHHKIGIFSPESFPDRDTACAHVLAQWFHSITEQARTVGSATLYVGMLDERGPIRG
jgi:hypothetical protein